MPLKLLLLFLASLLLSTMVSAQNEELLAPGSPPPPPPAPEVKPPIFTPPFNTPLVSPPPPPPRNTKECYPPCVIRCKLHSRKNVCLRACVTCCDRCKCVPPGQYGNKEKCGKCYANMTTRGGRPKCP
ncbi:hypothetical protein DCAR_0417008 [Daucus carota subsp. sativus]|uniref:Gibberellin regulated protein n=1 Tax=Daucus carota subsp. sativus TaxID=79200 RepID=A0AAF1AYD6_DAUCS|nr:hypothetical protein DCAR_0417008 [Daucus carota subsp. sativus]